LHPPQIGAGGILQASSDRGESGLAHGSYEDEPVLVEAGTLGTVIRKVAEKVE
jgi:hypothetical protein